jgi:ribosomal protein L12E/L44/L45/RPP1/RPP2
MFDGSGYPDKLRGDEIPLPARIVSLADAFDAMTSTRPYRIGLPLGFAMQEMIKMRGKQFCPMAVDAFVRILSATNVADVSGLAQTAPPAAGEPAPSPSPSAAAAASAPGGVPAATPEDEEPPEADAPRAGALSRAA